jgi:hypothetical protein
MLDVNNRVKKDASSRGERHPHLCDIGLTSMAAGQTWYATQ